MLDTVFENRYFIPEKLEEFGFKKEGLDYIYSTPLMDGKFSLTLKTDLEKKPQIIITDETTKEPYTLAFTKAKGEFVGQIRDEAGKILENIAKETTKSSIFQTGQAHEVVEFIEKTYNEQPEYLWEKFPEYAIFRKKKDEKWFGLLMKLPAEKLGLKQNDMIYVMDIKMDPDQIDSVIDHKSYFPAWHMNKKHWISLLLNDSIPDETLFQMITDSYNLA